MGHSEFLWYTNLVWVALGVLVHECASKYRKQEIVNLLHDIDIKIDSGVATETEREDRVKLIQEVDDLDRSESMDLAQKARVTWETEGDENMKLFHGMINQRRRKQYVQGILINGV
ncbi:hypothetical protein Tco_0297057 [Tanacetum coccineum]